MTQKPVKPNNTNRAAIQIFCPKVLGADVALMVCQRSATPDRGCWTTRGFPANRKPCPALAEASDSITVSSNQNMPGFRPSLLRDDRPGHGPGNLTAKHAKY